MFFKKDPNTKFLNSQNRRNKPLYKRLLKLRLVRPKPRKIFKFKNQKWESYVIFIKKGLKRNHYILVDNARYSLKWFTIKYKRKYNYNFKTKQKINLFFGKFSQKYLKSIVKKDKTNNNYILCTLEQRLDVVLYRSFHLLSIQMAKQLILNRHVFVNNKVVSKSNYLLKRGDFITVSKKIRYLIVRQTSKFQKKFFWPCAPSYLQINYKILKVAIVKDIKKEYKNFRYPFKMDILALKNYYKSL